MELSIVGIDLAKRTFQVHGADDRGHPLIKKRLSRARLPEFLAQLPQTTIAMEACSSAHHWGRSCRDLGHEVRLVPPQYARVYVKTHKNDPADAEGIVEAASRRNMRFVPLKSEEQQSVQALHRVRDRLKRDRTALGNEIRGLLGEFGIVFPVTLSRLRRELDALLMDPCPRIPVMMAELLHGLRHDLAYLDGRIKEVEATMKALNRRSEACRRLMTVPGIGELNTSAFVAAIGRGQQFRCGRDLACWLGLVPKQHSSAGRERLLGISKRGNSYLRRILIHGARSYVFRVAQRKAHPRTQFEKWIVGLLERKHINTVVVAVANKLARIIWAVLYHQTKFFSPPLHPA
jgi:transposase